MIKYKNECYHCTSNLYPCIGNSCKNRHVPHLYCDKCGKEVDELRDYYGYEWCEDCILSEYPKIEVEQ